MALSVKSADIFRRTPTVLSDSSKNRQDVAISGISLSVVVSVTIFLRHPETVVLMMGGPAYEHRTVGHRRV